MAARGSSLRRHPEFARLWAAQTISVFGSQISSLALPLTAILILKATPLQMGALVAIQAIPAALLGLVAGAWVDRLPRRPILIASDAGRALLLCAVPLGAWLGWLRVEALFAVGFLAGILNLCFEVAFQSLVPALVPQERLVKANSALEASRSIAQVAGPGLAGTLVQLLTAPVAVLADAISFLCSALCLSGIRFKEIPAPRADRQPVWHEAAEGLRVVLGNPILRALTVASALFNLFDSVLFAVYLLYLTRVLHITSAQVGSVFAIGGLGGLLGALLAGPLTARLGLGPALLGGVALAGAGELCIGLASGPALVAWLLVAAAEATVELGATIYGINGLSLRQSVTPDRLQGRVNATVRSVSWIGLPLGGLIGGALGQEYGLRTTALIAGVGTLSALAVVACSPVRSLTRTA